MWETNATLYASEQEQQNQLDRIFLNFDSGPRGPFAKGWLEAASWRPYVSGSYIRLDDVPYLEQLGLGINFMDQLSPRVLLDTNIEHSQRQFHDGAGGSRTITELDGSTTDARVAFRFALSDDAQLTLALDHTDQTVSGSGNSFRENHEWTGSVGVTKVYPGPRKLREWGVGTSNDPWTTSLTLARGGPNTMPLTRQSIRLRSGRRKNSERRWFTVFRLSSDLIPPSGMPDSRWGFPSGPISDSMW